MTSIYTVGNQQLPQLAHATTARRGASSSSVHDAGRLARPSSDAGAGSKVKVEDASNMVQFAMAGSVTSHPVKLESGSVATPASGYSDATSHNASEKHHPRVANLDQVAPFPPRPVQSALWRRSQFSNALTASTTSAASTADSRGQSMDVPAIARVYPNGLPADFLPWKGNHQEDNITELTIKSGFQNKPMVALNNESNTARISLWPHLKNKGGVQHLSALFINLLERRQQVGKITEPSTFKLPHRLAMTNTRRESYLRELADPNWPLRKLTRSIPHTVSGRVLLDQCLAKRIPVARAVWLAKCVGAHDLRAIKKKSASGSTTMGGEAKWIKEWTVHVEHFLKSVLTGDKDADLEEKMTYALQLSSYLFNERLLDEDHFIDWILSMFESSKTDDVFIWLLLVQMHWTDLVRNRRRGRRLAEAVLTYLDLHLSDLDDADDVLQPIYKALQGLLIRLLLDHKSCLVLPNSWHRFQPIIQRLQATHPKQSIQLAVRSITRRNNKLVAQPSGSSHPAQPLQSIFQLLDKNSFHSSPNEIVAKCLEHDVAVSALVEIIMQWASSVYRRGHHRIYMAARLIRRLQKSYDTEASIWNSVSKLADHPGCHELHMYQVVVELVRSGHFSVGRLLQYVIATGVASSPSKGAKDPLIRLLSHLPEHNMSDEVSNLRFIVLETAGISVCAEPAQYLHIQHTISKEMEGIEHGRLAISAEMTASLTLGQRFSIAFWIRDTVMSSVDTDVNSTAPWIQSQSSKIERLFLLTRSILEDIQEYPCLADVVGALMTGDNQGHLTSIVHTLHYNHRCFIAMGAMKPLFDKLVITYESLRARQSLSRTICSAILELSVTLDANKSFVAQVTQDLQRCDQLSGLAMCSPASDNVMELSASEIDSEMEIEKILTSGTTMDEQAQTRVFKRIASKIEESYASGAQRVALGGLLARLRSFDASNFDFQLRTWVGSLMSSPERASMLYSYVVPIIVGSSCITLTELDRFTNEKGHIANDSISMRLALHRLAAVIPDFDVEDRCPTVEGYKYKLDRSIYAESCQLVILRRLNEVLESVQRHGEQDDSFDTFFKSQQLGNFLSVAISNSSENAELQDVLCEGIHWNSMAQPLFQSLMDPTGRTNLSSPDEGDNINSIVRAIDELSLPFCVCLFRTGHGRDIAQFAPILLDAIIQSANSTSHISFQILQGLDKPLREKLFELSESVILSVDQISGARHPALENLDKYLKIVEQTTSPASTPDENVSYSKLILEKLSLASEQLGLVTAEAGNDITLLSTWIEALLRLSVIRGLSKPTSHQPADHLAFLSTICHLLTHARLQGAAAGAVGSFLFDAAMAWADGLPEDLRVGMLARTEAARAGDARVAYLFGAPVGRDGWLRVVFSPSATGAGAPGSGSSPSVVAAALASPGLVRPGTPHATAGAAVRPMQRVGVGAAGGPLSPGTPASAGVRGGAGGAQQQSGGGARGFGPAVPFPLKHWELLPDQGASGGAANDTAISLALVGTRRA